jgi:hypothetical protein
MRNISGKVVEKIKTHILRSIAFPFSKILPFMRKCEKYSTVRQAIDDNKEHAHCMLYNKGYKKNSEYVICFSTATTVTSTRLNVT